MEDSCIPSIPCIFISTSGLWVNSFNLGKLEARLIDYISYDLDFDRMTSEMQREKSASATLMSMKDPYDKDGDDRVRMKKQLGLLEGVAIILGIIFGSGK